MALLLAGCSGLPAIGGVSPEDEQWLLAGADLPGAAELPVPDAGTGELMALTPEMKEFAERAVRGHAADMHRVTALLSAIVHPGSLGLVYDQNATFTAREAFAHARANCLSFTALFVALARHVGLDANFLEVDVPPAWNLRGHDTLVLYRHISATVRVAPGRWKVVDIFPEEYDPSYPQRIISDDSAAAQYHNNLAMEQMLAGQLAVAQRHLARALEIEPGLSYLWGNLGALYRRAGRLRAAELSLVKAMRVNPRDFVAIGNAAGLYADTGRPEMAADLERLAAYFRKQNPYYRYQQGLEALGEGRYEEAKEHALAAIRLHDREHRFHFLLGAVYREMGEQELAQENFARAIELTTDREQAARYRTKMDALMSTRS